jgi:hypothetical protein
MEQMKIGASSHDLRNGAGAEGEHSGSGIESECIRSGFVVSPSLTRFGHSSFAGYRLLFRKINRLREGLILKRVVKRHLLGARIRENAAKTRDEDVARTIIGPESEDTARAQMCSKPGEPLLAVESGVLRIKQKVGGMIDVHEHCVKSAGRDGRIKARFGRREREEIALNEAAPEVAGQLGAERHQPFRMPFDHSFQRLDDKKRGDFVVL